ncbi:hypothetical protein DPEC_G00327980 [Dallia pectoralis]|uniref:Uncharacterized protein n=1 Tax=Dallia pectoralis TaxID=75939 RepID=A0ACC2F896_DALPE|nr:hypothetical protein DPEC_G00327980 [Dallia pectoralis]
MVVSSSGPGVNPVNRHHSWFLQENLGVTGEEAGSLYNTPPTALGTTGQLTPITKVCKCCCDWRSHFCGRLVWIHAAAIGASPLKHAHHHHQRRRH